MKKLVSILLTLAVVVSLLVMPAVVSADAPEVTVPFEFSADGRPELKDGSVSLDGENLIVELTAIGQNAKPEETNKHTAIYFDTNLADKDLSTASGWDMPWDDNNYVLVYNWYSQPLTDPKSLSWRQSYNDPEDGYTCPYGSPIPNPGMVYSDSVDWPTGLSFTYDLLGDDIRWTATVPISLLGVQPGDSFGMLVAARDQNTDLAPKLSLNSWPVMVYGFNPGYDLRDYALVTIPTEHTITFDTDPEATGSITFDGVSYNDGDTVDKVAGTYDIVANHGTDYVFSSWQVEGAITVANANQASTSATVSGDGTLRMVQTTAPPSPAVGGTAYPENTLGILAPWLAIAVATIAGVALLIRRRRAES